MAKKNKKNIVALRSSESHHRYYTKKNPRMQGGYKGTGKLQLMKFDPVVRKHVEYTEERVK